MFMYTCSGNVSYKNPPQPKSLDLVQLECTPIWYYTALEHLSKLVHYWYIVQYIKMALNGGPHFRGYLNHNILSVSQIIMFIDKKELASNACRLANQTQ